MYLEKSQTIPFKFLFFFAPSLWLEEEKLQNIFVRQYLETVYISRVLSFWNRTKYCQRLLRLKEAQVTDSEVEEQKMWILAFH